MDRDGYVESLRRDGARLADVAEDALERPVPSCPGWTVADLVWHTGEVHAFWRQVAAGDVTDWGDYAEPERPPDAEVVRWFRQGVDDLAAVLASADPSTPALTWSHQKDVGFVQRRMAQETAVHRWDAEAAAGRPDALATELALDGVDEFLDHFLPARPSQLEGPVDLVHLHATDAEGEWLVKVGEGVLSVERSHGKGDAAVRAGASDLLLLLWGRRSPDDVEVFGDRAVLDRFVGRIDRT